MKSFRLAYLVTHPITASNLMRGQFGFMRNAGMDVFLISSPAEELSIVKEREGISVLGVRMEREIHLWRDLVALWNLYKTIRKIRPDILNAGTPKAGFLGLLAAWMARVPARIYTVRGLRLETKTGPARIILRFTERIASALAHRVICVSESLKTRYIELGLVEESKTTVLGVGSSNGVDADRFLVFDKGEQLRVRVTLGLPENARVIGFVGRLTHDKGIRELLQTFELLESSFPNLFLVIVGDLEAADPIKADYARVLREHPRIIKTGFIRDPELYYQVMDLVVFTSYREGFPNVPLEAAAAGIPTVGFCVTGTVDAIEDGVTGRLVPLGNVKAMAAAISEYLENQELRNEHGRAARERVHRIFRQEQIWTALHQEYLSLLRQQVVMRSDHSQYRHVTR